MQTPVSNLEVVSLETTISGPALNKVNLVDSDLKDAMLVNSLTTSDLDTLDNSKIRTRRELNKLKLESLKIRDAGIKSSSYTSSNTNSKQFEKIDTAIHQVIKGIELTEKNDLGFNPSPTFQIDKLDIEKCWSEINAKIAQNLDTKIFSAWFKSLKLASVTPVNSLNGVSRKSFSLKILTPNKFFSEHIKKNYELLIKSSASAVLSAEEISLEYDICDEHTIRQTNFDVTKEVSTSEKNRKETSANLKTNNDSQTNLSLNYNFSNFVVGTCNQFAHAACSKVAESPGTAYNPLLIYGGVGLGKTHLANAIGNAARRRKKKVLLVSSEMFVTELIGSLKSNSMERFKSKFRSLDVLIIDDIQFIIGKERTQEEFFHTFNELYGKNKQIIITSDKLPQDLIGLEERLRTRFQSGLSVDLQAPDFETRVAILSNKCEQSELKIPDDVLKLVAMRIDTNVRELEGALTRLQALCNLLGEKPSLQLAQKVLDTISPLRSRELTTDYIKEVVAKEFNVSVHDLSGKRRTQNIALARQVAMFLCRKHTARSFPEIGALFGGRDHSTVIHAIRSITDRMPIEESLRGQIEKIVVRLEG